MDRLQREIAPQIPLGRIGRPEDVAKVVVFLASDDADYITGQILGVDGGQILAGF
jgi:3-oxoacyl-[acyl-carrier protein] reductase